MAATISARWRRTTRGSRPLPAGGRGPGGITRPTSSGSATGRPASTCGGSSSTFSNITGSTARRCSPGTSPPLPQESRKLAVTLRSHRPRSRTTTFFRRRPRPKPSRTPRRRPQRPTERSAVPGRAGKTPGRLFLRLFPPADEHRVAPGHYGENRRLPDPVMVRDRLHLQRVGEEHAAEPHPLPEEPPEDPPRQ